MIRTSILDVSRRNNRRSGITGALLCGTYHFVQVLEGSFDAVMATMSRVRKDSRHWDVETLRMQSIDHRAFPRWDMAEIDLMTEKFSATDQLLARAHVGDLGSIESLYRLMRALAATDASSLPDQLSAPEPWTYAGC